MIKYIKNEEKEYGINTDQINYIQKIENMSTVVIHMINKSCIELNTNIPVKVIIQLLNSDNASITIPLYAPDPRNTSVSILQQLKNLNNK